MKQAMMALVLSTTLVLGLSIPETAASPDRVPAFASFAGSWYYHGINVDVTAVGVVYAIYRTYTWCSGQQRYECDHIVGSHIVASGLWAAYLHTRRGAAAIGFIAASAVPSLAGTTVVLERRSRDAMLQTWGRTGRQLQTTLCASAVPPSTHKCGA